jgi:hypothetical protein
MLEDLIIGIADRTPSPTALVRFMSLVALIGRAHENDRRLQTESSHGRRMDPV